MARGHNALFVTLTPSEHGYIYMFVTLTPSEHEQLAGLVLCVKVEPAQLGLATAPVYWKIADRFPRLDAS